MADKKSVKTAEKTDEKVNVAKTDKASKSDKTEKSAKSGKKAAAKPASKTNKVLKYFKDLRSESKKVVWPSRKTVVTNTGVVLVTMVVTGLGVFGMDSLFAYLFKLMLEMVK